MYKAEPLWRVEEQRQREPERETRKEDKKYKPFRRRVNFYDWVHPLLRTEKREAY